MAMNEFLRSVQTARNVALFNQALVPGRNPLSPMPNLAALRRVLTLVLSPRVVAGYEADEFGYWDPARRTELTAAVTRYRELAEAATTRELTDEELTRGMDQLFTIVKLLDTDLLDEDGQALMRAVVEASGTEPFPDFVLGLDYTLDTDWSGDPGIWIWVIVPDELDPESEEFSRFSSRFRKDTWRAMAAVKSVRIPYVRFRVLSEITDPVSEEAA